MFKSVALVVVVLYKIWGDLASLVAGVSSNGGVSNDGTGS